MTQQTIRRTAELPALLQVERARSRQMLWAVLLLMLVSAALRTTLTLHSRFPLGVGGLEHAQITALVENNFRLPEIVSYNRLVLPYAQPPVAFYLMGAIHEYLGVSLLDVMRWFPVIVSVMTLPIVYLLTQNYLGKTRVALLATAVFSVMPSTIYEVIGGGGGPAALGTLFALMALWQVLGLFRTGKGRYLPLTAVFTALALMSHIQWGVFTIISITVLFLVHQRTPRTTIYMILTLILTVVLLLPWLVTVFQVHSVNLYMNVLFNVWDVHTPLEALFQPYTSWTQESALAVLSVLALLGIFVAMASQRFGLVLWTGALLLLQPDAAFTVTALPLALLIALTLDHMMLPGLASFVDRPRLSQGVSYILVAVILAYALITPLAQQGLRDDARLQPLPTDALAAMLWTENNVPTEATFLLLTAADDPLQDSIAAWFPVLAERGSVNTVDGTEWNPSRRLDVELRRYATAQGCIDERVFCIEQWRENNILPFTHIWFSPTAHGLLSEQLRNSPDYALLLDENGYLIFSR
jgi:hypothetical protein